MVHRHGHDHGILKNWHGMRDMQTWIIKMALLKVYGHFGMTKVGEDMTVAFGRVWHDMMNELSIYKLKSAYIQKLESP